MRYRKPTQFTTSAAAAERLGYSLQHTRLLLREGKLQGQKFGRDWMVLRESVASYKTALLWPNLEHEEGATAIVNVASVPQRSPFRYPGGKTWLVPRIRQWLRNKPPRARELVEPFAGGGIVGLTAVFEALVDRATLVEIDADVASVWKTILNGQARWLAEKIASFELSRENIRQALLKAGQSTRNRAFATILRNRVNRGGILAPGAGLVKRGENGKGLSSRWYPKTLRRRILDIHALRAKITFVQCDGIEVIERNANRADVLFFIDPPYTVAGRRLYAHSKLDHEKLFAVVKGTDADFLMTYDDSAEIRRMARRCGFRIKEIPMKNTHHARKIELAIGRNLDWFQG